MELNTLSFNNIFMSHPKHIDCYNIYEFLNIYDDWYVTIKMDGYNLTFTNDINHISNKTIRYNNQQKYLNTICKVIRSINNPKYIEMEFLNKHNIVFIFDLINENNQRLIYSYDSINYNNLNDLIEQYYNILNSNSDNDDNEDIKDEDNELKIINKPYFKINNNNKLNELKLLFHYLNNEKLNKFADGFVLTNFKHNINIKLKPFNKLSIDLKFINNRFTDDSNNVYNLNFNINTKKLINNNIYQLVSSSDNHNISWKINRIRHDKSKPNNNKIISNILQIINYWNHLIDYIINFNSIDDIPNFLNDDNYYEHTKDTFNKTFSNNHNIVTNTWINIIKTKINNQEIIINNIMDIGCGAGYVTILNFLNNISMWLGIDCNYTKIKQIHDKYIDNSNIAYILANISKLNNTFQQQYGFSHLYKYSYDTIFMIHSAHYMQTNEFKTFITNLLPNINNVIIVTINHEYILSLTEQPLSDNNFISFIHPKNNLKWSEPIFNINFWTSIFNPELYSCNINKIIIENLMINKWFLEHQLIIFKKI